MNFSRAEEHPTLATHETLQAEVLRLSRADRAKLLDRLITILDKDPEIEAGWMHLPTSAAGKSEKGLPKLCHWKSRWLG